jgi:hypothetical protein
MKVGDMVRIKAPLHYGKTRPYQDTGIGAIGMIIENRYDRAFVVVVLGEVAEFDVDEVEVINVEV